VDGEPVALASPREALGRGIATVYQDLALIPLMSVWRNFVLGAEPEVGRGPLRRLDVAGCMRIAGGELGRLGVEIRDLSQPVGTLSGGERQALAIARAIHFGARVLILDEPTAALGVRQAAAVLEYVTRARERGVGVVVITHNPHHAMVVGDRFVVLRQGEVVADRGRGEIQVEELGALMASATIALA
jgi:simple sugar transport system ATP-binding protein